MCGHGQRFAFYEYLYEKEVEKKLAKDQVYSMSYGKQASTQLTKATFTLRGRNSYGLRKK